MWFTPSTCLSVRVRYVYFIPLEDTGEVYQKCVDKVLKGALIVCRTHGSTGTYHKVQLFNSGLAGSASG